MLGAKAAAPSPRDPILVKFAAFCNCNDIALAAAAWACDGFFCVLAISALIAFALR